MNKSKEGVIGELLSEITPLEQKKTDTRMMIAARIDEAMKNKGWMKKDLLKAIGQKHPSVITKWLSGTHNFTIDTLVELENTLGICLITRSIPKLQCDYFSNLSIDSEGFGNFSLHESSYDIQYKGNK